MGKPREVLVIYDDRSSHVTKLALNLMPVLDFPISRRNIRWGTPHPRMYAKVITIGVPEHLCISSPNSIHLPYDGYSAYYRRTMNQGLDPDPVDVFQEEEAHGLAESLEHILVKLC